MVLFLSCNAAAVDENVLSAKIDEIVRAEAGYDLFSGTVLVAVDGDVIYSGAFGHANKDHETVFHDVLLSMIIDDSGKDSAPGDTLMSTI